MLSLFDIILSHIRNNINDVLERNCTTLLKLDDEVLLKLADRFTIIDVEAIDCKMVANDKTGGRKHVRDLLYWRLICSLVSPKPVMEKGQFWSLRDVFMCKHCKRLVPAHLSHRIECVRGRFAVRPSGDVMKAHERAAEWNLDAHLNRLKEDCGCDWRRVYWRLWSQCHYLLCDACETYYPVNEPNGCRRHGNEPVFSFVDEEGISTKMHPIGRYTCCGAKAYRYQSVPCLYDVGGCRTTEHAPRLLNTERPSINNAIIMSLHRTYAFENVQPDEDGEYSGTDETGFRDSLKITGIDKWPFLPDDNGLIIRGLYTMKKSIGAIVRSYGLESAYSLRPGPFDTKRVVPICHRENPSFVPSHSEPNERETKLKKLKHRSKTTLCCLLKSSGRTGNDDVIYNEGCCLPLQDINGEDRFFNRPIQYSKRTSRHKKTKCGLQSDQWMKWFSTRFNQDRQREYEDNFFVFMDATLTKRAEDRPTSDAFTADNGKTKHDKTGSCDDTDSDDLNDSGESLSSYCSTLNSSVRVRHSRTTSVWNSYNPLAGSYVRIEAELRDACLGVSTLESDREDIPLTNVHSKGNVKTRKPPTFTVQQHYHLFNRKHSSKMWFKNENSIAYAKTKTKVLQVPLLKDRTNEILYNSIWSYDTHSQELDYLSAAYIPLPIAFNTKHYRYFKTIRNELSNEWSDLIDLEKSWTAFLCLFSEHEFLPIANEATGKGPRALEHRIGELPPQT